MSLLSVNNLSIGFRRKEHIQYGVRNVTFSLHAQETLALVGESGSGKSVIALSLLQLLPRKQVIYVTGDIQFKGRSLLHATENELRTLRGARLSLIGQNTYTALNPSQRIGIQLYDALTLHYPQSYTQAHHQILAILDRVGLPHINTLLQRYPHELSSGERQRIAIAMAIIPRPDVLIADEPTAALGISHQKQIVGLLQDLKHEFGMSLLLITHNMSLIRKNVDNVLVMKDGSIVEYNTRQRIFLRPSDAYTRCLVKSDLSGDPIPKPSDAAILLNVPKLHVPAPPRSWFSLRKKTPLVDKIQLSVYQGESVGVMGNSGAGKTTVALALLKLIRSQGIIQFDGKRLDTLSQKRWRVYRQHLQLVFQDPYTALNPQWTVEAIVQEGILAHKKVDQLERQRAICAQLEEVGIDPNTRHRSIETFSGGERQRIALARALIMCPQLLILDEPISLLDPLSQQQILKLLKARQRTHQISYILMSHNMNLLHSLCHHILVLHQGTLIEQGSRETIFTHPAHPQTQTLIQEGMNYSHSSNRVPSSQESKNWKDALLFGHKPQNIT